MPQFASVSHVPCPHRIPTCSPLAIVRGSHDVHLRQQFCAQELGPLPRLYGLAGTVTSAAALMLELTSYDRLKVDGSIFSPEEVDALRQRLASMTLEERRALPNLGVGRADVIVSGLSILLAALQHCGARELMVRDRGLRYACL